MMGEEKLYPIKVLAGESYCERDKFQVFDSVVHWRGDSEREVALSRLGNILGSIRFPFSVEVALGLRDGSLWITLEKVKNQRISSNDQGEHLIYLFGGFHNLFFQATTSEVVEEFLRCLSVACRECSTFFSEEEEILRLRAEREGNKALVLRELEIEIFIEDEFTSLSLGQEFWWD